ncbi:MAG: hypothetical protein IPH20_18155 [Bacteroidales bacterium]|nr:hypothetical protein [Bacteroidales bacterium]
MPTLNLEGHYSKDKAVGLSRYWPSLITHAKPGRTLIQKKGRSRLRPSANSNTFSGIPPGKEHGYYFINLM